MSFLTGLGSFGSGAATGVDAGQRIAQRAQQIQQAQMALDAAKKQTAADAAAFSGIGMDGGIGGGGGSTPQPGPYPAGLPGAQAPQGQAVQPMAPGQPSMPSQPPQATAMPPQQGSAPPTGGVVPQSQQPGQQAPQGASDISDPMAGVKAVMTVAQGIKARNPNIDPQTLMLATQRVIDLSKGMAPALRQQAGVVIQQMRDQTSRENTQDRTQTTQRGQDIGAQNVQARIGSNEKIAGGHDAASLQRVQQQGQQAMARTQASIAAANDRAKTGQWSREKTSAYSERVKAVTTKLRVAQQQLSSLQNSGVGADDPRAQKAANDVQKATQELDRVDAAAKVPAPSVAPAASGGGTPEPTHMLRGKPIHVQDGKWVFEDGSEAK